MTGVGYIELEAPDINASIDFYTKVLGFELESRSENGGASNAKDGKRPDVGPDPCALLGQRTRHEP
jgi:catechol 2,3-dioxygenase-like lactoylglutathione lyase family enzyme